MESYRLALIAHRFQHSDGQGRVNYEVAKAALDRGLKVTLLTAHCAEELASHPKATVVTLGREKRPTQLLRNLAFASDSAQWLRKHKAEFDVVQANGFITWEPCDIVTAHFVHSDWANSPYSPFVGFSLSPYILYQKMFTSLNSRWEKRAFKTARRVIAVSEIVGQEIEKLGVPAANITVIYNGVDTVEYHPGTSVRMSFGLPEDVPMALFVGDIRTARKNLDSVLKAMVALPDLHLAVAGDPKGSPFPAMAEGLGIAARVYFLGKTSRIADLMRSVDLFVFPSRYEAHPLVVLEAMASGLPTVISANVGSAKSFGEVFDILSDPDDVVTLTSLMGNLMQSPERRRQMSEAARQRSLDLQWSKTVDQYLVQYQSMLRK